MHEGYVALLDVLGFTALVGKDRDGKRVRNYLDLLSKTMGDEGDAGRIEFVVFSDSIILTTVGDDLNALQNLVARCAALYSRMLEHSIAVRGAISFGKYIREKVDAGVFVAGDAIIEAYQFEQAQQWIGIMLAPSVLERHQQLAALLNFERAGMVLSAYEAMLKTNAPWAAYLQVCETIPFKGRNGNVEDYRGFAIVPGDSCENIADTVGHLWQCIVRLTRLEGIAPDPSVQRRYRATAAWLNGVRARWVQARQELERGK